MTGSNVPAKRIAARSESAPMIAAAPPKAAAGKLFRQAVMHGIRRPQPTAPPQNSRLVLPEMRLSAPAAAPGVPESAVRTKAKSTKASPPCTAQPAACSQRGDSASSFPDFNQPYRTGQSRKNPEHWNRRCCPKRHTHSLSQEKARICRSGNAQDCVKSKQSAAHAKG